MTVKEIDFNTAQSSHAELLLKQFIDCQNISPYRGWDIDKVKPIIDAIDVFCHGARGGKVANQEMLFLAGICVFSRTEGSAINITALGRLADAIRKHFGLPTVEDLNPEIAQMREKASKSEFFKNINRRFQKQSVN